MGERLTYMPPEALGMTEELSQQLELLGKRKSQKGEWDHFMPDFVGTKAQSTNVEDLVQQLNKGQEIYMEGRISQPEGRIRFNTDLPVSIFFIGDVHFGSYYTNHNLFMKHMNEILETPNAYVVFTGNLIDNAIPSQFPSNMLVNGIPPDKQVIALRKIAEQLNEKDKLLGAVVSPCHEGWTAKHTGQDINALMFGFPERKFPVLENGGQLHINFEEVEYNLALFHQVGPFESNFNETHALRQLNRLNLQMKADVVVGAHRHFAAAEMVYEGTGETRKPVAYIRSGTYKGINNIHDMFSVDRYGSTGEPSGQSVTLWPKAKRMATFLEFDTGILAHENFYLWALDEKGKEIPS